MKKLKLILAIGLLIMMAIGCNDSISRGGSDKRKQTDRRQRGAIDTETYIDFTMEFYDARKWKKEDVLKTISYFAYKNGNSSIKIDEKEETIEIMTDSGLFNGKQNCQIYAKYSIDIQGASSDCLYIRRDPRFQSVFIVDNVTYRNDQIPDLALCIPLYGYSKGRIEVSPIMNGYISMPSGTYWRK